MVPAAERNPADGRGVLLAPGGQMYSLTDKPITTLAELKDHKMWALPGAPAELMKRLGVPFVSAPSVRQQELFSRHVVEGAIGSVEGGGTVREIGVDDAAIQLAYAQSVIVVPGYGLAVAQAQHAVRELADQLEARGVDVKYAIHPVAGRMPGHMNVLLAEANVPYPQLREMEDINPEFERTDVALVVGANDVTNPAARRPGTPVSGMPILDVDRARSIIVIKRSMGRGYAGIDNELYANPKTGMLFADAKAGLGELTAAVKAL